MFVAIGCETLAAAGQFFLRYESGYTTASFDRDFDQRGMNFLGCAGFLFSGPTVTLLDVAAQSPRSINFPSEALRSCGLQNGTERADPRRTRLLVLGSTGAWDVSEELCQCRWKPLFGLGPWILDHDQ